jgi:hypothetical protein
MNHFRKGGLAASSALVLLIGCSDSSGSSSTNPSTGGTNSTGGASGTGTGGTGTGGAATGGTGTGGTSAGGMTTTGGASGSGSPGTGGASGAAAMPGAGGAQPMAGAGGAASGSAGMSTSGAGGGTVSGSLSLTIEPNPNSVLSCYVSWKTEAPANSVVQFGIDDYQWEISDDAAVTDHKVLVIGMRAENTYKIKGISGQASGEGTFTSGKPPAQVLNGTVMVNEASRQPGWTLVNTELGSTADNRPRSALPPAAVIYDEEGYVVWYFVHGPGKDIGGAVSTQRTDKGVVIGPTWNEQTTNGVPPREVDWAGNVVWECTHAACLPGKNVTHETQKLSNGNYVVLEYVGQNPVFRELDSESQEVWTLDWAKLLPAPSGASGDWCHANAINIDIEKNEVYANCRWIGLMKTTYTNPTYEWLIAAEYGGQAGDFTYVPPTSQYSDAHSPDFYDDTNAVLFFDNGGFSGSVDTQAGGEYHSRAVEYTIDTTAKTATLTWEFPGDFATPDDWYQTQWYSPFWGDVDRLANGNVLVAGGMIGKDKPESRVFEVTKADGKVVWELRLTQNIGVYRAERIVPPLVHAIAP